MNININNKRALQIAKEFLKERKWEVNTETDIKSIKFYSKFRRKSENVWVAEVKVDLMGFEGTDILKLVISDKKEIVEYWLDQNGIPQMF